MSKTSLESNPNDDAVIFLLKSKSNVWREMFRNLDPDDVGVY